MFVYFFHRSGEQSNGRTEDRGSTQVQDARDHGGRYAIKLTHTCTFRRVSNISVLFLASYDFLSKETVTSQSEFLGDCLRLLSHTFTTLRPLPVSEVSCACMLYIAVVVAV